YCLLAVGILIAMNVINLGVTQMSFVLGGLAVGLGFGLQELFANFVSGIILLFEQPLRIGDIVSIGDVTGTVTKIRIRATTVTDWDRKEYIIPNKELITGTFRNWTLSDSTNRIVIEVGVAYGSNTDQARRLLLDVCREHPKVLKDPLPSAVFDRFGDSALNLTLRCFLADFEDRLNVIHELHTAIDRKFKQAKIEIAFPQMDLHLRSIDKSTEPLPLRQSNPIAPE
ncbi:MAG TPA: mechanosensitive ion channel domain-containing protein, partial [Planctomycetaceae bacterium]|nr:mechanosensitive ion channel domain-containing protein [Planctomycetaceae bacterium]